MSFQATVGRLYDFAPSAGPTLSRTLGKKHTQVSSGDMPIASTFLPPPASGLLGEGLFRSSGDSRPHTNWALTKSCSYHSLHL